MIHSESSGTLITYQLTDQSVNNNYNQEDDDSGIQAELTANS